PTGRHNHSPLLVPAAGCELPHPPEAEREVANEGKVILAPWAAQKAAGLRPMAWASQVVPARGVVSRSVRHPPQSSVRCVPAPREPACWLPPGAASAPPPRARL